MNIVISILTFILGLAMFFWFNRDKKHFRFDIDEVHHAYYGWLILWIAPLHLRLLHAGALFTGMMLVGIVLVWDDIYQPATGAAAKNIRIGKVHMESGK